MWFPYTPAPAHRIPKVSGTALPVGRVTRVGQRRRRLGLFLLRLRRRRRRWRRWRRRRAGGLLDGQIGRVAVAGDQRLDHLDDLVAVGRRVERRRPHTRSGRRRRTRGGRSARRRWRRRRHGLGRGFGRVRVVGQVAVLWTNKRALLTSRSGREIFHRKPWNIKFVFYSS